MGLKRNTRMTIIASALIAVLGLGLLSVGTGIAAGVDHGFTLFAQRGNGNGNGNNGQGNGNGNGNDQGNAPEQPGTGNNGQGQGQENGNPPETNPGNGNGNAPAAPEVPETDDTSGDGDVPAQDAGQGDTGAEKVDVCHVTGNGESHMISVSVNALPAHEAHGDTADVASEEDCVAAAPEQPAPPVGDEATPPTGPEGDAGTPVPVDDGATPVPGDEDGDEATPGVATPIASPVL